MRILVIGGTGFLSSAVVRQLLSAGHDVTAFTRGERPASLPPGVTGIRGDRHDRTSFVSRFAGERFDAVVDCICYDVDDAEADLTAFAGRAGQLMMISTDFVYGANRTLPMDEETPRLALSDYGRKKAAAEDVLLAAGREGRIPTTILRPPHIMGAGGQLGTGSLQGRDPMLLDRLRRGQPVMLLDGGALLIQPVVHDDIGRACCALAGCAAACGQAYNVAGPDAITTRCYYERIAQALGVELQVLTLPAAVYVRALPDKAPFAQHRTYSTLKLGRDTGYAPETGVEFAIFSTIDWLEANELDRPYSPGPGEPELLDLSARFQADAEAALGAGRGG